MKKERARDIADKHRGFQQSGKDLYDDVLQALTTAREEGYRSGIEDAAKVAEETYCGCDIDKQCCAEIQAERSTKAIRFLVKGTHHAQGR